MSNPNQETVTITPARPAPALQRPAQRNLERPPARFPAHPIQRHHRVPLLRHHLQAGRRNQTARLLSFAADMDTGRLNTSDGLFVKGGILSGSRFGHRRFLSVQTIYRGRPHRW